MAMNRHLVQHVRAQFRQAATSPIENDPTDEELRELLAEMTDEEKVGLRRVTALHVRVTEMLDGGGLN